MDIYVQKDGQRVGPLPESRIRQGIDSGNFVPADLAWTTGNASWQPLSTLINLDVNQPPPFPAHSESSGTSEATTPIPPAAEVSESSEAGLILPPLPADNPSFETVLYRDVERYYPHIVVSNKRLKVNDDSYSLDGVTSVKLHEHTEYWRTASKVWRRVIWLAAPLALLGSCNGAGVWGIVTLIMFSLLAFFERRADRHNRSNWDNLLTIAQLVLTQAGKPLEIRIGSFRPEQNLFNVDKVSQEANAIHRLEAQRVKTIAEAVGSAIGTKALVKA